MTTVRLEPPALLLALACAMPGAIFAGPADSRSRDAARAVLAAHRDAVITVRLTVKTRVIVQGRERNTSESTLEVAGTLLSASGLTAVSDFTTNPGGLFPSQSDGPRFESEPTDVKLVLRDGRELGARFVLRDRDLDLAFLMPEEAAQGLPHVKLQSGPAPQPLDDLVFLFPMGKALNREVAVVTAQVRAVLKKPRTFIVASFTESFQSLGGPAFDESGRAIGLVLLRRSATPPAPSGSMRDMFEIASPIVLTASDVLEVSTQATQTAAAQ